MQSLTPSHKLFTKDMNFWFRTESMNQDWAKKEKPGSIF
jgi:hypothetical protein